MLKTWREGNDTMTEVTNERMYEVLKALQHDVRYIKDAMKELRHGQTMIRRDVHEVKGDIMRRGTGAPRSLR